MTPAETQAPIVLCPSPLLHGMGAAFSVSAEVRDFQGNLDVADEDRVYLEGATLKRRAEFAAGRLCAAEALKRLGLEQTRVHREQGGAPIWPAGALGSISHTLNVAAAIVARADDVLAIGLDIEAVGLLEPALWPTLFSAAEQQKLGSLEADQRDAMATALFAAKEAFYKAQWPITREWLDFLDIEIAFGGHAFTVYPRAAKTWTRILPERPRGALKITRGLVAASILATR